ncbi:MAG: signal peptidase I [Bacteroidales bacterium]|nr:signal peptidase I [Bacteroidales bacterium]
MKVFRYITIVVLTAAILLVISLLVRVFICDTFIVRGSSMEPTLFDGERVCVNKLTLGARIYTDFNFDSPELKCFRMPGLREANVGDIVVINDPYFRCRDSITFTINRVYVKRCYGCPGDTIKIVDGHYVHPQNGISFGPKCFQNEISELGDAELRNMGVYVDAWNVDRPRNWTILDMGPIYVPKKGGSIHLTLGNYRSYRKQIHYETGMWLEEKDEVLLLNGKVISEYQFLSDWYFLGGDNVLNSRDSRYIGFMPGDFIVGIVNNAE